MSTAGRPSSDPVALLADLRTPAEPDELRRLWRRSVLDGEPWEPAAASDVGSLLWEHWGRTLQAAGMDSEAFTAVLVGYRRELWLWMIGERQWEPAIAGLVGRVRRRLPPVS
jgi:hypothetical protein